MPSMDRVGNGNGGMRLQGLSLNGRAALNGGYRIRRVRNKASSSRHLCGISMLWNASVITAWTQVGVGPSIAQLRPYRLTCPTPTSGQRRTRRRGVIRACKQHASWPEIKDFTRCGRNWSINPPVRPCYRAGNSGIYSGAAAQHNNHSVG